MADAVRATIDLVRKFGDFDETEFSNDEITTVIPLAHVMVMFQMKPNWEQSYEAEVVAYVETLLIEAECDFVISRLYRIKADRQLDTPDEDSFTIGQVSIQPGGAQQRIFNKDYQFLADKYEMQGQAIINMVMPSNTQVFFKVG